MAWFSRGLIFSLCVAAAAALGGCKQGEGERCEIDSDCSSGLICTTNTPHVCRPPISELPDAAGFADANFTPDTSVPTIDAGTPDAAGPDAPVDAGTPDAI